MKFVIEGAWKHDGGEVVETIEALTEADARRMAAERGILVSSVEAQRDVLEDLVEQAKHAKEIKVPRTVVPINVLSLVPIEASRLRTAGSIIGVIAWFELVIGVIGGIVCAPNNLAVSFEIAFAGIVACALCQGVAGMMRMLGLMGMMMRDAVHRQQEVGKGTP